MIKKCESTVKSVTLRGEDSVETRLEIIYLINIHAAFIPRGIPYKHVKGCADTQYSKLIENTDFLTSPRMALWRIYGAAICAHGKQRSTIADGGCIAAGSAAFQSRSYAAIQHAAIADDVHRHGATATATAGVKMAAS